MNYIFLWCSLAALICKILFSPLENIINNIIFMPPCNILLLYSLRELLKLLLSVARRITAKRTIHLKLNNLWLWSSKNSNMHLENCGESYLAHVHRFMIKCRSLAGSSPWAGWYSLKFMHVFIPAVPLSYAIAGLKIIVIRESPMWWKICLWEPNFLP